MSKLTWNNWYRTKWCRENMDRTFFRGTSFSAIFWAAMARVFVDQNGRDGVLYNGRVFQESQAVVRLNNRRNGFDASQQSKMLRDGDFLYGTLGVNLSIQGPDPDDGGVWASAPVPGFNININFNNIIAYATQNFGNGADALDRIIWFTGAIVLHEVMHNNGFDHPDVVNWRRGSDYASSLPHVALAAVLRSSTHSRFFDTLIDIQFLPPFGFRQIYQEPEQDKRTLQATDLLELTLNEYAVREEQSESVE